MLAMSLSCNYTHNSDTMCINRCCTFLYYEYFIFRMIKQWADKYFEWKKEAIPLVLPKALD